MPPDDHGSPAWLGFVFILALLIWAGVASAAIWWLT